MQISQEMPLLGLHKKEKAKGSKQLGGDWSEMGIAADLNNGTP